MGLEIIYLKFKIIQNKNVIVRPYCQTIDYNAHLSHTMILQTQQDICTQNHSQDLCMYHHYDMDC